MGQVNLKTVKREEEEHTARGEFARLIEEFVPFGVIAIREIFPVPSQFHELRLDATTNVSTYTAGAYCYSSPGSPILRMFLVLVVFMALIRRDPISQSYSILRNHQHRHRE